MIQIAIMGLGTVGTGVARVVEENAQQIQRKLGEPLQVKTVLVRHFHDGPYRHLMTDDFRKIEEDPDIRVVVETIGGVDAAYTYTRRALEAGKHVVTANKQLVAEKGCELLALAREHHVRYLFEASVGGGIPILHPLTECMAANRIDEVYGILNGTTNYILTRMVRSGASFEDALKEAQTKGDAEVDPTAAVEGIDAGRQICILADLAFGRQVDPERVPMEGITRLSLQDVEIARQAGYRIKLLGRAVRLQDGACSAYVAPHLIPAEWPLASVEDVFNAVVVKGNATGEVMFYGKGAGEMPTASACVADVMEALQTGCGSDIGWEKDGAFKDPLELTSRYYFRIEGSLERAAVFGTVKCLWEDSGQTALLTDPISGGKAEELARTVQALTCLRVLD